MTLELAAGEATLLLCPALGGSIGGWSWRGVPVLRPTPPEALAAPVRARCPAFR